MDPKRVSKTEFGVRKNGNKQAEFQNSIDREFLALFAS
jgi:hypothetical protein